MKKGKLNCIGKMNFKFVMNDDFVCDKVTKLTGMVREIINGTLCITK